MYVCMDGWMDGCVCVYVCVCVCVAYILVEVKSQWNYSVSSWFAMSSRVKNFPVKTPLHAGMEL